MGSSTGRLQDPDEWRPWDQMMGRSKDICGTLAKEVL